MTKQGELKKQAYESDLKSRALSILIYLIDRSNQELTCFPAISTMARELHISVSTVKRGLKELVDRGYVKKESRFREKNMGQTSNLYILVMDGETEIINENYCSEVVEENIANEEIARCFITFEGIAQDTINKKAERTEHSEKGTYSKDDTILSFRKL